MMRVMGLVCVVVSLIMGAPADVGQSGLTIELPAKWQVQPSDGGLLLVAKDTQHEARPGVFVDNVVITNEPMRSEMRQLFNESPAFYTKVILYQTMPGLRIVEAKQEIINGKRGAHLVTEYTQGGMLIQNVQFYFIHSDMLYGVVFSTLSRGATSKRGMFEESLHSLR